MVRIIVIQYKDVLVSLAAGVGEFASLITERLFFGVKSDDLSITTDSFGAVWKGFKGFFGIGGLGGLLICSGLI